MRRSKRLGWVVLLGAVLCLSGCWGSLIVQDEADDGSLKAIKVGDTLLVRLSGNPTGGYSWEIADTLNEAILEPVGDGVFTPDDPNLVGGSGVWEFTFKAVALGTTTLDFGYRRPWEEESLDTFTVTIFVQ